MEAEKLQEIRKILEMSLRKKQKVKEFVKFKFVEKNFVDGFITLARPRIIIKYKSYEWVGGKEKQASNRDS